MKELLKRMTILAALLVATDASVLGLRGGEAMEGKGPQRSQTQPEPYMRIARLGSNVVQLQIAARKFVHSRRSAPVIWLTGASHIGESNYFAELQKHLDDQALVLFEGVSDRRQTGRSPKPTRPSRRPPASSGPVDEPSLQSSLAESLGLVFQLKAIDYGRPHFHNSDLSISQLQRLMQSGPQGSGEVAGEQFNRLLEMMDETTFLGALAKVVVNVLGSSAKLQAITKLALIESLGQIKGDISQMKGLPPDLSELMKLLIQARNQAVLDDLKLELKARDRPRSISIFYGAGHMPDMEQRLTNELKYRPKEQLWFTAFSVNLGEAGVTESEAEMIRSLVKWQMDQLQP